jgi:hypothetical protein
MNIRIQTYGESVNQGPAASDESRSMLTRYTQDGTTAYDALMKGLEDLVDLCDVVVDKFSDARTEFARGDAMDSR